MSKCEVHLQSDIQTCPLQLSKNSRHNTHLVAIVDALQHILTLDRYFGEILESLTEEMMKTHERLENMRIRSDAVVRHVIAEPTATNKMENANHRKLMNPSSAFSDARPAWLQRCYDTLMQNPNVALMDKNVEKALSYSAQFSKPKHADKTSQGHASVERKHCNYLDELKEGYRRLSIPSRCRYTQLNIYIFMKDMINFLIIKLFY